LTIITEGNFKRELFNFLFERIKMPLSWFLISFSGVVTNISADVQGLKGEK